MQHLLENEEQRLKRQRPKRSITAWAIGLTVFWPIVNLIVYFMRFGTLSWRLVGESLYFIPLGLCSVLLLFTFLNYTQSTNHAYFVIMGFVLFMPVAFFAALASGLVLPPLVGPMIYGIIPLAIGLTIGFFTGKLAEQAQ